MMARILSLLSLIFCFSFSVLADNKDIEIRLNTNDNTTKSIELGFGYMTFQYVTHEGNEAKVRITLENISSEPHAVLIFKYGLTEQVLKKNKPKIEFEKKFPGGRNKRKVDGCNIGKGHYIIVTPTETDTLFTVDVPFTSYKKIDIPFYIAKYKAKDLKKKGENNINYKILEKHDYRFTIYVQGWTEEDSTYLETKNSVEAYLKSLEDVQFCNNKKHKPSLKVQQQKYVEQKDSLIKVIGDIINVNGWMSDLEPHKAYSRLSAQLREVNLDDYNQDCGKHTRSHKCNYCSLSAQDLYHRIDDIYQQLYAGAISKENAVKTAKAILNCYQNNKRRRNDSSYGKKISGFYNRIINY